MNSNFKAYTNSIFKLISYFGKSLYPIYYLWIQFRRYSSLIYPQIVKFSLSKPYPLILFLGRKVNFVGSKKIIIGNKVQIDSYSTISTWSSKKHIPTLQIGKDTKIGAFAHITCINKLLIGENVLIGKYVTITDNSHGNNTWNELNIPPAQRLLYSKGDVIIGDNVWIGDKVTILPNIKIGKGAVIGANSVVTMNIPPYAIACGNPIKIIRSVENE